MDYARWALMWLPLQLVGISVAVGGSKFTGDKAVDRKVQVGHRGRIEAYVESECSQVRDVRTNGLARSSKQVPHYKRCHNWVHSLLLIIG